MDPYSALGRYWIMLPGLFCPIFKAIFFLFIFFTNRSMSVVMDNDVSTANDTLTPDCKAVAPLTPDCKAVAPLTPDCKAVAH